MDAERGSRSTAENSPNMDEEYVRRLVLLAHNLAVLFASLHGAQPGDLQKLGGLQILEEGDNA